MTINLQAQFSLRLILNNKNLAFLLQNLFHLKKINKDYFMKNIISVCLLISFFSISAAMEKPSQISLELGEWHNRTPNTYEIEELSPHEDGLTTAARSIGDLGNGKLKKINHKVSLEPVGQARAARYRIYNVDNIDDAAIIKIEHKPNEITASMYNPKNKEKKVSKPAIVPLDKSKSQKLDLSLIVNLEGKNLESSKLNFTSVKSKPRLITPK